MTTPLLEISGLTAGYGRAAVLDGVDLTVGAGEIVALLGANGAGKSTLLMTICGNPRPSAGSIRFDGSEIGGLPTAVIARLGIAQVPEGRRVFQRLSVLENLQLGATAAAPGFAAADLERVLALFPVLAQRRGQRAGTLSGGEQQMLALGRALMARPRLLLLDEPSQGLAPQMVRRIFAAISEIRSTGIGILLVESSLQQALRVADRGSVLQTGRIVLEAAAADLLANEAVRAAYLGGV